MFVLLVIIILYNYYEYYLMMSLFSGGKVGLGDLSEEQRKELMEHYVEGTKNSFHNHCLGILILHALDEVIYYLYIAEVSEKKDVIILNKIFSISIFFK